MGGMADTAVLYIAASRLLCSAELNFTLLALLYFAGLYIAASRLLYSAELNLLCRLSFTFLGCILLSADFSALLS